MRPLLLSLAVLIGLSQFSNALYFYLNAGENRCFLEELPKDTIVVGHYKAEEWQEASKKWIVNDQLGIQIVVSEVDTGDKVVNTRGLPEGKFTFTSHEAGDHTICLRSNYTGGWFSTPSVRMHLDIAVGEAKVDEDGEREHVKDLASKVRDLNSRLADIRREQQFQREREAEFRALSEKTNSRAVWWNTAMNNSSTEAGGGERSGQGSPAASSPLPTPSGSSAAAIQAPRSPYLNNSQPLSSSPSSSGFLNGGNGGAPSSPSLSSSANRFGLSLGNLVRRPRGWTTSSAQRSPGAISPGSNNGGGGDQPPSPSGGERGNGYGFPALRRSLSKRTSSSGANGAGSGGGATAAEGSRTRHRRSSSQPPQVTQATESGDSNNNNEVRPGTAGGSIQPSAVTTPAPATESTENQRLRLVPHLESSRSLHFEPIERDLAPYAIVKVGRFTDRSNHHQSQNGSSPSDPARVAFKSKVVSRGHAEIWADESGKFFIKDTKSSSGTFLNHIRLSAPNTESRPFPLKDGDVLQLGVDYQGGTEEIYRCVKMRVELNRAWQRGANSFNTAALAQLRALGGGSSMEPTPTSGTAMTATASHPSNASSTANAKAAPTPPTAAQQAAAAASITDCCICLYPVTVCQALFIAPCSHVTHFKCIRPLVEQNYPGFCCPLCRTYADLEADVEIDPPELPPAVPEPSPSQDTPTETHSSNDGPQVEVAQPPSMAPVEEAEEPASRAGSIRSGRPGNSRRSSAIAVAGPDGLPPGITVTPHRSGRSRPSSRAPSIAEVPAPSNEIENREDGEDLPEEVEEEEPAAPEEDEEEEEEEESFSPARENQRPSPSSSSHPLPMPFSSTHLSATSPSDLYASLSNATTPPNNTFLSTLADSSALHLTGMGMIGNSSGGPHRFEVPISGEGSALGTPMSLDAALEAVERPVTASRTSAEATRSGSGSGGEETDRDLVEGEADEADGETEQGGPGSSRENVVMPGGTEVVVVEQKSKGKGKELSEPTTTTTGGTKLDDGVKKLSIDGAEDKQAPEGGVGGELSA
ncbi:hypothetical protein JCM3765_007259 [Sporobolomyces pararoseus]